MSTFTPGTSIVFATLMDGQEWRCGAIIANICVRCQIIEFLSMQSKHGIARLRTPYPGENKDHITFLTEIRPFSKAKTKFIRWRDAYIFHPENSSQKITHAEFIKILRAF